MNEKKIILNTIAFLLGVACLVGVSIGAYRELHGGPMGVMPIFLLFILVAAGLTLLFTWRRDIARDPAMVPAGIFAVCTFFYYATLREHVDLERFAMVKDSSWVTFLLGLIAYFLFYSLAIIPPLIIYHGSKNFLNTVYNALRPRTGST